MSQSAGPFPPASNLLSMIGMDRLKDPWVRGIALTLFVLIVLATATRVSPPTPLQSERPVSSTKEAPHIRGPEQYAWLNRRQAKEYVPLIERIPAPDGYTRVKVAPRGFADWLRHLPLAAPDSPVRTGKKKMVMGADDPKLAAVIALQPSNDRLLAGPNLLVRLRAEYLWSSKNLEGLGFHFTSGHRSTWESWAAGQRPTVRGREVTFKQAFDADESRESFCSYLETVFQYGSVYSVMEDTIRVADGSIAAGDIFLRAGKKGYSLMVLDACHAEDGSIRILLGDAGTPAQTFHVLRAGDGSAWFSVTSQCDIVLPDGRALKPSDLRRWR